MPPSRAVFLDVDNTLLDNDAAKGAMVERLAGLLPPERAGRFWELYEIVRRDEDYVDFPATVARYRAEFPADPCADDIDRFLAAFPYRDFVFPGVFETIERLWRVATPAILSDGDPGYQPRKIERAGLAAAVRGNVFVFAHKEDHVAELARRLGGPAPVYVDDKAPILGRIKRRVPEGRTVHVLQGKYAALPVDPGDPPPDATIDRIAGLDLALGRP